MQLNDIGGPLPTIEKLSRPSPAMLRPAPVQVIWTDDIVHNNEDGTQTIYPAWFRRVRPYEVLSLESAAQELYDTYKDSGIILGSDPELFFPSLELCRVVSDLRLAIIYKRTGEDGALREIPPYSIPEWFMLMLNQQTLPQLAVIRSYVLGKLTPKELEELEKLKKARGDNGGSDSGNVSTATA